jgi:hypothetical protein
MNVGQRTHHLEKIERLVVAGEMRITRQLALIDRLQQRNVPTEYAEIVLRQMENILQGYYAHRKILLRTPADWTNE